MSCKRCEINEAWERVRNARTYTNVVARAVEWLDLFWPEARLLGQSPKSLRDIPVPAMYISPTCGESVAGRWNGKAIQLQEEHHYTELARYMNKVHKLPVPKIRDELRVTILHEVVHAVDEHGRGLGVVPGEPEDLFADHDSHFHRRLDKLKRMFPPDGA